MTRPVDQNSRKLAPTTLQAVLDRVEVGVNDTQIYYQNGVDSKCTRKKRRNLEAWGQPYAPNCVKTGRPSTLRDVHRRRLREYLEKHNTRKRSLDVDLIYLSFFTDA